MVVSLGPARAVAFRVVGRLCWRGLPSFPPSPPPPPCPLLLLLFFSSLLLLFLFSLVLCWVGLIKIFLGSRRPVAWSAGMLSSLWSTAAPCGQAAGILVLVLCHEMPHTHLNTPTHRAEKCHLGLMVRVPGRALLQRVAAGGHRANRPHVYVGALLSDTCERRARTFTM